MEKTLMDDQVKEAAASDVKLKDAVRRFERTLILEELSRYNDDKEKVAKQLGISLSSLYRKLTDSASGHEDFTFEGNRNN